MRKTAFIDLETTGLHEFMHGVIQIAVEIYVDGQFMDSFNQYIHPFDDEEWSEYATETTGWNKQSISVSKLHVEPLQAHRHLSSVLAQYVNKKDPNDRYEFIAYNAEFDFKFLKSWFGRCGDQMGFWTYFYGPYYDVLQMAQMIIKESPKFQKLYHGKKPKSYKLEDVFQLFFPDENINGLHDSASDIRYTKRLYDELIRILR